jgi:hypothetical protein
MAQAVVYIDGFSLYYGAVKGTPYRWLNLVALADDLLEDDEVLETRYYVSVDPDQERRERQATYLEALATLNRLAILDVPATDPCSMLAADLSARAALVGRDGVSLVVSDDGRLTPSVGACFEEHRHSCGVASPSGRFHPQLRTRAGFRKRVGKARLIACVLPDPVYGADGAFHKPAGW